MNDTHNDRWIESLELEQIDVNDLQIGMYVSKLDRPWLETNFWFQGFELKTQADIEAVQAQCSFVYIDVSKRTKINEPARRSGYGKDYLDSPPPRRGASRSWFNDQLKEVQKIHSHTSTLVKSFLEEAKFGRPINTVVAKRAVATCVDSILKAPDALMLMAQLKNRDEYTAQHSMNVCIYAIALGRQLKLDKEALNNLGLCGMMHDMGKMQIPPEVLNKPGRLTKEEMDIMETHAAEGARILMSARDMYAGAVDVAHMHHERLDGSGYPRGLYATQITPYAQMVTVVDMYDAITSDRVYQRGRSHLEAIRILTESSMNGFIHTKYTMKFIECLGVYPIGSLVELVSGEVGVVLQANTKAKLKPKIMVIMDANKQSCNEYIVDLAMLSESSGGEAYRVKQILPAAELGVDLRQYCSAELAA